MLARFSLAALFAVLVAVSAPRIAGGSRDLLAVGATLEETGTGARRTVLGVVGGKALESYEEILRSPAREALLQGTTVYAPSFESPLPGWRVVELVYYGTGSRAGRAPVSFTGPPGGVLRGAAEAHEAAVHLARLPSSVTVAAARVLLGTRDTGSYRDALRVLASLRPDAASAEARRAAVDPSAPAERRIVAIRVLGGFGGAAVHPEEFAAAAADPDPQVRDAAKAK